nr:cysteine peptidase family C39 domain-containing protein [uncultured Allomuricauda sp.]
MNKRVEIKQHDLSDCGAACLASIAEFYNLSLPLSRIRQYANTNKRGTTLLGLREAASKIGFTAKGVKVAHDSLPEVPLPAIAHVTIKVDQHEVPHYMVLYKVTKKSVTLMDPTIGKLQRIPITKFNPSFTGILLIMCFNCFLD